jgi:DNA-binding Xre family transcriptional regulator
MNTQPTLDLLAREVAEARGITSVVAFATTLGVSWRTASDLWNRRTRRISRLLLATMCAQLSCEPHHLLRLVDDPAPNEQLRGIGPLPTPPHYQGPIQIVLRFRAVAEAEFAITDITAFSRHVSLAWGTAAELWRGRAKGFDLATLARAVAALGGAPALQRLIQAAPLPRAEATKQMTGLAVPH